jgi:hypothetical protein
MVAICLLFSFYLLLFLKLFLICEEDDSVTCSCKIY